jgi:pyruvate/2-oxoglutarate dehydrogenase complex dihydrolipoamide acyltransferase (E2) component
MAVSVLLPRAGMGVTEATISSWLKGVGDRVEKGEVIAEMETAKTNVEIEAPVGGVLTTIVVPEGEMVEVDVEIATIEED